MEMWHLWIPNGLKFGFTLLDPAYMITYDVKKSLKYNLQPQGRGAKA